MITQAQLKKVIHYSPETGVFTWLVKRNGYNGGVNPGDVATNDNGLGYLRICIDQKRYVASRLAFLYMMGEFPKDNVDHISGDTEDNRWCNLRAVSHRDNMRNMKLHKTNTSGQTGVSFHKQYGKYHAYIYTGGKRILIGYYNDLVDAITARKEAEAKYGYHENHGRLMP